MLIKRNNKFAKIAKLFAHRLFSINHLFFLYRDPNIIVNYENDFCIFKQVSDSEKISECSAFESIDIYAPIYKNMIMKGDAVIFGYRKNDMRCMFRACVQLTGNIISDGCFVKILNESEGYIHYVFCDPLFRGNGAHPACINYICNNMGDKTLFTIVAQNNISSLKGFYKNGFVIKEDFIQINFLGFRKLIRKEHKK